MAALLVDEDVSEQVAHLLNRAGHDASTVRSLGLKGARDYTVLLRSAQMNCMLITHNAGDFILLHGAWLTWTQVWGIVPLHAGILILPPIEHLRPADLVYQIDAFIAAGWPTHNANYLWRSRGGWVRRDPA